MKTLAVVALVAAVLGCGLGCGSKRKEHVVIMRAMTFDPPSLVVSSGDRVTWRNEDIVAHTATAEGRFDSGEVPAGQTYTVTLTKAGALKYACRLHPTMLGSLDVQ